MFVMCVVGRVLWCFCGIGDCGFGCLIVVL